MNRTTLKKFLPFIYVGIIALVLVSTAMTRPEPEIITPVADVPDFGMTFPENYRDEFVLYLVVDRIDLTVRNVFAHPDAVAAITAGEELPFGTQIVIETWDAHTNFTGNARLDSEGHFIPDVMRPNVHVMEKRATWTVEDLPSPVGVIDWNFGSFDAGTMRPSDENRNDCLTCHDGGAFRRDFVFSRTILESFTQNNDVQYLFCNRPRRGNCIR